MRIVYVISEYTNLSPQYLLSLARSASHRYKSYTIPKANGRGTRLICHPSKKLKLIQRWLAKRLFSKLPQHPSSYAYKKGMNVRHHADLHRNSNFLLKVDFKDFFPSIKSEDIKPLLSTFRYKDEKELEDEEKEFIIKVITKSNALTIGAPSSPIVSNAVMYAFDTYWHNYAVEHGIKYSRYADDIYFSTNTPNILNQTLRDLRIYLRDNPSPRLRINDEKVVQTSKKRRRIITGLNLTPDGKISIGRDKKREIKSLVNSCMHNNLDANRKNYLSGFLCYAMSVEPEFIISLKRKYGEAQIDSLL